MQSLLSALASRCPNCHRGRIRASLTTMRPLCDVCGVRFERKSGNWLFPVVIAYGVGGAFAIVLIVLFLQAGRLAGSENIIIPLTLVVTLLAYPFSQNLTVWLLHATGLVYADPQPPEP
jgi:uncharacterized protein (DUF983 family)